MIGRPVVVSGLSSGGVLACWLSAYVKPGQVVAACYEDPPLFASQVHPATGPGIRQSIGPMFDLWSTFLGDQWSIGAWDAMRAAAPGAAAVVDGRVPDRRGAAPELKEYDPEWGKAFWTRTVAASCDHEQMLRSVKVPHVLLTHHLRVIDEQHGRARWARSATPKPARVRELLRGAGVSVTYREFPTVGHAMHSLEPDLYVDTLVEWVTSLGS